MAIGNTKLHKLLDRAERLSELEAWISSFDKNTKEEILRWVKEHQLSKGFDANGERLKNQRTGKDSYSYTTELRYAKIGRSITAGSHYTMHYKKDFYNSLFVRVLIDSVEIDGDPEKENGDNLYEIYGRQIAGLSPESVDKLRVVIKEKFIAYVRKTLFGGA